MLLAQELSNSRRSHAALFAARLKERATPLGMQNLRCEISMSTGKLTPDGIDVVEFLFAFNKNQTLPPRGRYRLRWRNKPPDAIHQVDYRREHAPAHHKYSTKSTPVCRAK